MPRDKKLKTIHELMHAVSILVRLLGRYKSWAIIGSANLAIRGANLSPSDIDIITTHETADEFSAEIEKIAPLNFKFSKTDTIHSYYGRTSLCDIPIDIMADIIILTRYGDWQAIETWQESVEYIPTRIGLLPLMSLDFERYVYFLLGQEDRVKIIDSILLKTT